MSDTAMLIARLFPGVPFLLWGVMKLHGGEAKSVPVLKSRGMPDAMAGGFFALATAGSGSLALF